MKKQKNIKTFIEKIFEEKNSRVGCLLVDDRVDICGLEVDVDLKKEEKYEKIFHHPFHKLISVFPLFYKLIEHINFDDDEEKECTFEKMWCSLFLMNNCGNPSFGGWTTDNSAFLAKAAANMYSAYDLKEFLFKNFNVRFSDFPSNFEYRKLLTNLFSVLYVGKNASNPKDGFTLSSIIPDQSQDSCFSNIGNNKHTQSFFDDIKMYASHILKFKLCYVFEYRSPIGDFFYFVGANESLCDRTHKIKKYFSYIKQLLEEFNESKNHINSASLDEINNNVEKYPHLHSYIRNAYGLPLESMYCHKFDDDGQTVKEHIIQSIEKMICSYNKFMRNAFFIIQMKNMLEFMQKFNEQTVSIYEVDKEFCLTPVCATHLYNNIYKPLSNYLENIFFFDKEMLCFPHKISKRKTY